MRETLLELAEEPGLWIPPDPSSETIVTPGYVVVTALHAAMVQRIRLGDREVAAAVDAVRALGRERELEHVSWWVGERSAPAELAAELLRLGLEPSPEQPLLTTVAIAGRPSGDPTVDVRRVDTVEDYLRALEIDWEVWEIPSEERVTRRAIQREAWPAIVADGRSTHYLAYVDDEPVGFGRAVFTPWAGLLMGGATLPHARGRGVYTALVHARWEDAAARGTPRLVTGAGPMSTPVLEGLGFERLGRIQLLRDRL